MKKIPQPHELPPARSLADALSRGLDPTEGEVADRPAPVTEPHTAATERPALAAASDHDSSGGAAPGRGGRRTSGAHPHGRRYARERALQALYQWDLSAAPIGQVRQDILSGQQMNRVDVDYFLQLYDGVATHVQRVDDDLAPALDRRVEELDPIERAILRVGVFELQHCPDVPARVIINEAVEITKRYGADQGHKYVNGVLDKLAMRLRPVEMRR